MIFYRFPLPYPEDRDNRDNGNINDHRKKECFNIFDKIYSKNLKMMYDHKSTFILWRVCVIFKKKSISSDLITTLAYVLM